MHEGEELAIEGVANWTDIWTDWHYVGDDFTKRAPANEALHKNQMKSMKNSAQEKVVTKRRKLLGKGGYGRVWLVDYKKRVNVSEKNPNKWSEDMRATCKVMRLKTKTGWIKRT